MVPITGSIRSTLPRASTRRRRPPPHPSAAVAAAAATIQFHHDCLLSDSYTFKNHHHLHLLVALSNRVRSVSYNKKMLCVDAPHGAFRFVGYHQTMGAFVGRQEKPTWGHRILNFFCVCVWCIEEEGCGWVGVDSAKGAFGFTICTRLVLAWPLYLTVVDSGHRVFSVCLCARFQEAPKTSHLEAIKRIFRYIKGTSQLGLWYPKGTGVETIVYADSDHARDYVDRKSTSGVCTFMGCCITSWFSMKQTALAISTTEAEYVFVEKAFQQALWMIQALVDYDINLDDIPRPL
ncbi:hypothetical protein Tco_1164087 [Tanacetum coccineum]